MFFEVFDCADIFLGIILQKNGASFLWSSVACKLVAIYRTKIPTVPQAPVRKKSNREVLERSQKHSGAQQIMREDWEIPEVLKAKK